MAFWLCGSFIYDSCTFLFWRPKCYGLDGKDRERGREGALDMDHGKWANGFLILLTNIESANFWIKNQINVVQMEFVGHK